RVHISRANAYARVERLRSSGVILGFRAEISPEAVGLRTSAYVTLNLHQTEWRTVQQRLLQVPGVVHVALVGGEFDVVLLVRARDNADLRRVVLDEVQAIVAVTITGTKPDRLDAAAAEIALRGARVRTACFDITDRDAFEAAADDAEAEFGKVDILCNNAGRGFLGSIVESSPAQWEWLLAS